jgi:glycine/D-amino acid oxidase-like deaminating enzyme
MSIKTYDIAIIGGGFAGSALAYYCTEAGASVLLLEAGSICCGTSSACAGRAQIIESETDDYLDLVVAGFNKLADLGVEIDTNLEWELPGHLTLLFNEDQWKQYESITKRLTNHNVEAGMLDLTALREIEPHLQPNQCIGAAYSKEGHLNPFKFCMGFANAARRKGATIMTNTSVTGFGRNSNRITSVQSGNETYFSDAIILASGAWSGQIANLAGFNLPMHFTHAEAFVTEPLPKIIDHHVGISGFYEAVHGSERTVTLGLGQHKNGTLVVSNAIQKADKIDNSSTTWGMPAIARALSQYFPRLNDARIIRTWAMPSPFLPDFLPAIGWIPQCENIFVAAGFHLAIPTIPLLAENIASLILQNDNTRAVDLLKPYSPNRFKELLVD